MIELIQNDKKKVSLSKFKEVIGLIFSMSTVEIFDAFAQMNLVSSTLITVEEREEINKCIVNQIKALVDKIFE